MSNKINIIAEIGWNHMGSISLAEKMIKAAKSSGADYAKFQTWKVKNLRPGPWDNDGRKEIYTKAELNKEQYLKLKKICVRNKIKFLTSLFNPDDYDLISHLNCNEIKIPSPENRNRKLLQFCKKKFSKIFLSTGAASVQEIKKSFKLIKDKNVTLMHCVSAYPCKDRDSNILRINKLKKISKHVGLSDHTKDILSSVLTLPLGICLIEKHFTIDNKLPGRDNKFAILPGELKTLRKNIDRYLDMIKAKSNFIKEEVEIRKLYTSRWTPR